MFYFIHCKMQKVSSLAFLGQPNVQPWMLIYENLAQRGSGESLHKHTKALLGPDTVANQSQTHNLFWSIRSQTPAECHTLPIPRCQKENKHKMDWETLGHTHTHPCWPTNTDMPHIVLPPPYCTHAWSLIGHMEIHCFDNNHNVIFGAWIRLLLLFDFFLTLSALSCDSDKTFCCTFYCTLSNFLLYSFWLQ